MIHRHLDFPFVRHRLANGLEVVLQPDSRLPLVTVDLWYHVGSKNERPGKTGFAHLFEHMLFQGSANVDTNGHFTHLQKIGGVANGSTSHDRTNYYETVPAHHLELALWLEADRMGFLLPAMTSAKLENQREVVMNERRQRVDNQPYGRAFETLNELLFPAGHPYHWPVIGTMEDIAAATLADVTAFFEAHYRPNNAVLTLVGDFHPDSALALVEKYFADIPGGDPPPPVATPAASHAGERRAVLEDAVRLPRVYAAYRVPPFGTSAWTAADVLATALASGKSSPMYRDLVYGRQIAQNVSVAALPTELEGSLVVAATGHPETDPDELLGALDEHLERARREALAARDLERCRNGLLTAYVEQLQRFDLRADILAQATTLLGEPGRYADRLLEYSRVSPEDIRAFAAATLAPEDRAVVTVVPRADPGRRRT
ncbi:MAG: insulinase family protein [Acidobacteriota bacterium]|nr:insulinase family protein [Acidobacteriota bacterium]MDH3522695.1 insulinase family protein [Acidobacteriota bacterium]